MTLARTGRDSTRSPKRYRPPARDSFGLGAGAFYGGRFQVIGSTWEGGRMGPRKRRIGVLTGTDGLRQA